MFEPNYYRWLKEKSKIENFDKLYNSTKYSIYEVEQELTDNDEVNLIKVLISDSSAVIGKGVLFFDWVGYEKELEELAEFMDTTQDNVPASIIVGSHEALFERIDKYFCPEFYVRLVSNRFMLFFDLDAYK